MDRIGGYEDSSSGNESENEVQKDLKKPISAAEAAFEESTMPIKKQKIAVNAAPEVNIEDL